jgi:hypothetical protein
MASAVNLWKIAVKGCFHANPGKSRRLDFINNSKRFLNMIGRIWAMRLTFGTLTERIGDESQT